MGPGGGAATTGHTPAGFITSQACAMAPVTACIGHSKAFSLALVGWLGYQLSTFAQAAVVSCTCVRDATTTTTTTTAPATTTTDGGEGGGGAGGRPEVQGSCTWVQRLLSK